MINPLTGRTIKERSGVYFDLMAIEYIDLGNKLVRGLYNIALQRQRYMDYAQQQILPSEIICIILQFCDINRYNNLRSCCTYFYDIAMYQTFTIYPALKLYFTGTKVVDTFAKYIKTYVQHSNVDIVDYVFQQLKMQNDFKHHSYTSKLQFLNISSYIAATLEYKIQQHFNADVKVYGYPYYEKYTIRDMRKYRYDEAYRKLKDRIYSYSIPQLILLCKDNNVESRIKIDKNNKNAAINELIEILK